MLESRKSTGILVIVLLAVLGYVLVTIPPRLVEQYDNAKAISPVIGYVYLAVVGIGSFITTTRYLYLVLRLLQIHFPLSRTLLATCI